MEWNDDMSAAPKDGQTIVAMRNEVGRNVPSFIFWDEDDGWCGLTAEDEKRLVKFEPTHWFPLPSEGPTP